MYDLQTLLREFQERPLAYPLLSLYAKFMNIRRYDQFPFYIYPQGMAVNKFEDRVVNFVDYLVDAHELERNR